MQNKSNNFLTYYGTGKIRMIFIAFCLTFVAFSPISSQTSATIPTKFGVSASLLFNHHFADFTTLSNGIERPNNFTGGNGTSVSIMGILDFPISSALRLSLRGGYVPLGSTLEKTENREFIRFGNPSPGIVTHSIDASLSELEFNALLGIKFFGKAQFHAGISSGFILKNSFVQAEIFPIDIYFPNGSNQQELASGDITGISTFQMNALFGVSYAIPLNQSASIQLAPEFFATLPITKLWSDGNWKVSSVRLGVGLLFSPSAKPPVPLVQPIHSDTNHTRDTVVKVVAGIEKEQIIFDGFRTFETKAIENGVEIQKITISELYSRQIPDIKPLLSASVSTIFVLDNGVETNAAKVTMEEFFVNKYTPLLNFLFFDDNSSDVPPRYSLLQAEKKNSFDLENLGQFSSLEIYHQVLNIIGQRLHENPKATISITGCNSNVGDEKNNASLSLQRANVIKNYLNEVWKIKSNRISIYSQNLPDKPSAVSDFDGIVENRRVEITSNSPEITQPVTLSDTLRTVDPPTIRLRSRVFSEAGVKSWKMEVTQAGRFLKEFHGSGEMPTSLDWQINKEETRPVAAEPLEYQLTLTDNVGQTFSTPKGQILFEQITLTKKKQEQRGDKIIDRYSLILFDFDQFELTDRHTQVLDIINSKLTPKSQIKVIGSTDRLGDAKHNQELSEQRASAAAKALKTPPILVLGIGEDETTYPNDTPEGRFYSRTVRIVIETPVEK